MFAMRSIDEPRNGSLYGELPFLDYGSYDASRADNLTLTNTLTSSNTMYIAGLYLSHAQGVESIVCLTTAAQFFIASRQHKATARRAETEGGSIVKMPTSVVGRIVTPIQIASFVVPTVVYFASVVTNRMVQPAWMQRWRLPLEVSVGQEAWLRTAACLAAFGMLRAMSATFGYLGKQYHYIGVSLFSLRLRLFIHRRVLMCCDRSVRSRVSSQQVLMESCVTRCIGNLRCSSLSSRSSLHIPALCSPNTS